MKRIYIKAFNQLKKLGVPVYEHVDDQGNFSISAERAGADEWVSYHSMDSVTGWMFGVNPKLDDILRKHGLFCEWVNPGRLSVHPA